MNMQEIAICYIVKDEAEDLRASLDSLSDVPGERIVCSTAGSDAVRHVAEAVGARILSFSWTGDFSAARNFLLERVRAKWLIFLDADESLASCPGGLPALLAGEKADLLLIPWRNIDRDTGEDLGTSLAPRIFRGDRGFRYFGRIHEELRERDGRAIERIRVLSAEELLLLHTGYSKSLLREKGARNLALLLKEREGGDASALSARYLADAYDGLGDTEEAIRWAWEAVKGGRSTKVYASAPYDVLLRCLARTERTAERRRAAEIAVRDFPELPAYRAELASALAREGELKDAVRVMEEALAMREESLFEPSSFGETARSTARKWLAKWKAELSRQAAGDDVRITACLIARDEAKDLPRWLASTSFADERIVVDTGSSDATAELARQAGCTVAAFPWRGDFAAVRNAALALATGEWVVFLDADEQLERPEEVRPYLAALRARDAAGRVRFLLAWMKNIDEDKGGREIDRVPVIRIFRREGAHYVGRVHETLAGADGAATLFVPHDLAMRHTGYSTGRIVAKAKRNLALLQEEIREGGESVRHYPYLAKSYFTLGDFARAQMYALRAIVSSQEAMGAASEMYAIAATSMERCGEAAKELLDFLRAAAKVFPMLPDFPARIGLLLADMEEEGALEALLRAISLAKTADESGEASGFAEFRTETFGEAVRLLAQAGRTEEARRVLAQLFSAVGVDAFEERVLAARWALAQGKGTVAEALCYFRASYPDDAPSGVAIARFFERAGLLRAYLSQADFLGARWGISLPRTALYRAGGKDAAERLSSSLGETKAVLRALSKEEGIEAEELSAQLRALLPEGETEEFV